MKIYLDTLIFDLQQAGGASSYCAGLADQLRLVGEDIVCIERVKKRQNIFRQANEKASTIVVKERQMPLMLQRFLPITVPLEAGSIFHSSYYRITHDRSIATIVTVYDCIYERYRFGLPKVIHMLQKKAALRAADGIICISMNTQRDMETYYPWTATKPVKVIPLAVDKNFHPLEKGLDLNELPGEYKELKVLKYILYVGERVFHKNFSIAVETVAAIPGVTLVLAGGGKISRHETSMLERLIPGRYRIFCRVSLLELNYLYNNAFCLLYPSKYEGFGLPILEAMQSGCPVVAMRSSSIPEVCGNVGLLADEDSPDAFVSLINRLEDVGYRCNVVAAGLEWARRFSWEKVTQETLDFYQEVAHLKWPRKSLPEIENVT
jgi:mannosyltransferase